jgi:Flp pilus assembly protein TadD
MRGLKFDERGSFAEAAAEFEKAAAFDPEFSEAHGNLGVEYTAAGRLDEAVSEFHHALALDPATSFHHSNLAFALIRLGRDKEAEGEAQAALGVDPTSGVAHLLLGAVLAQRPEKRGLAESHLSAAAQTFPAAHLVLSRLYREEGASEIAAAELKRFRQASALVNRKQANHNQAFVKP